MSKRITAPNSSSYLASNAYLGDSDLIVSGARLVQVGLQLDGTGLVAGTIKVRIGDGSAVEFGIPAGNLWSLEMPTGCHDCLPVLQIDAKSTDDIAPRLVVLAV